jgi:hypothetical protein
LGAGGSDAFEIVTVIYLVIGTIAVVFILVAGCVLYRLVGRCSGPQHAGSFDTEEDDGTPFIDRLSEGADELRDRLREGSDVLVAKIRSWWDRRNGRILLPDDDSSGRPSMARPAGTGYDSSDEEQGGLPLTRRAPSRTRNTPSQRRAATPTVERTTRPVPAAPPDAARIEEAARQAALAEFAGKLSVKDRDIDLLRTRLESMNKLTSRNETELRSRAGEIRRLEGQLVAIKKELDNSDSRRMELEDNFSRAQNALSEKEREISRIRSEHSDEIAACEKELASHRANLEQTRTLLLRYQTDLRDLQKQHDQQLLAHSRTLSSLRQTHASQLATKEAQVADFRDLNRTVLELLQVSELGQSKEVEKLVGQMRVLEEELEHVKGLSMANGSKDNTEVLDDEDSLETRNNCSDQED